MNINIKTLVLVFLISLTANVSYSQVTHVMLKSNPILKEAIAERRMEVSERSVAVELPFYDDFSYEGPYTNLDNWIGNSTFVNNNFALNNPSIGVATFDGLNSSGTAYGGGHGAADTLTSRGVNLSGLTVDALVNLSFYIEAGGQGYSPASNDNLVLQFKKSDGSWIEMSSFVASDPETFLFKIYNITESDFLHANFQFRFINYCSRQGIGEIWHLDYVRLQKNIIASEVFDDIAFTKIPSSLLDDYTAVPKFQFQGNEASLISDNIDISIYNHFENTNDVQNTSFKVKELNSDNELHNVGLLNGSQADIPAGAETFFQNTILSLADLKSNVANISNGTDPLILESKFDFTVGEEDASINSIAENNSVTNTVNIDKYFAYDDGTAEAGIACGNSGNQIAVKFTSLKTDSLYAIAMHIPHITNTVENQNFNLKVWIGTLDDTPEYEATLLAPDSIAYSTANGFKSYIIMDEFGEFEQALEIPTGDFYIGWQQVSSGNVDKIPVGLDYNTDSSDNFYFSASSTAGWNNFGAQIDGSLMLRPYFERPFIVGNSNLKNLSNSVNIYPNPTSGALHIDGLDDVELIDISILNINGQKVFQTSDLSFNLPSNLASGIYLVKILTNEGIAVKKFIKQ